MPVSSQYLNEPKFLVVFIDKVWNVDCILEKRPIATVLAVSRKGRRRIIKIVGYSVLHIDMLTQRHRQYPRVQDKGIYTAGFASERRTYRLLRSSGCTAMPRYFGSTSHLIAIYPDDTNVPQEHRIIGEQRANMVDYFEGEMIDFQNITPAVANRALEGLAQIHQLSIFHGDTYEAQCVLMRNVMVSKSGEVKWIDFEHSKIGEKRLIDMEMAVALALWGPDGKVWKKKYV
jgi:hypothetical protein